MHAEWHDMAALRSSQRYAKILSLILLAGVMLPFTRLQQPKLDLLPTQRLVLDMRFMRELAPSEPHVEPEKLLADESPFVIQDQPVPKPKPRIPPTPPPPEPIKKVEKKPAPSPTPVVKPKPKKRV